jgi:ribosomal protein S27AE
MGKTYKHEKSWGKSHRNRPDEYDDGWDELEDDNYTVEDFFANEHGMRLYCSECGYVEANDLVALDPKSRNAMCPECGGPAELIRH